MSWLDRYMRWLDHKADTNPLLSLVLGFYSLLALTLLVISPLIIAGLIASALSTPSGATCTGWHPRVCVVQR